MPSAREDARAPACGVWLVAILAGWCCWALPAWAQPGGAELRLRVGEVRSLPVHNVERVAIGDPKIADVSIISGTAVLVKAVDEGTTNLIVWDERGETTTNIIVQIAPPEERVAELKRLLEMQHFNRVQVKEEGDRIFLVGEVDSQEQLGILGKLTGPYKEVVALAQIKPGPIPVLEVPLVELNLEVVELTKDYENNLGVDWVDSVKFTETPFDALSTTAPLTERIDEALRLGSYTRKSGGELSATLNALVKDNKARVLSQPRLVTLSGKPANVFVGGQKPVITTSTAGLGSGVTSKSIEFKDFGVRLKITPLVSEDLSRVTSQIEAEVSTIDTATAITVDGVSVPGFKIRRAATEMTARSGETLFIAGLLSSEDSKDISKVPGVGNIPILGALFTSTDWKRNKTELVITVTPTVVKDHEASEAMADALDASADAVDPLTAYARQVQERIAAGLPSTAGRQGGGTVRVRLHLFADGHLAQTLLLQSSGDPQLDDQVVRAIEAQAPYPSFPPTLLRPDAWMEIPVVFQDGS
ncbi:MAG: TonB family protein [Candidatus Omnitrophica bacterium]|nr:TonB family protein [Candidatus Omnitrophota bacterium]